VNLAVIRTLSLLVLLAVAADARAQTADDFGGNWQGPKETRSLAELRIVQEKGRWTAHAFGACTPRPCDWGVVPFTVLQQRPEGPSAGLAIWRLGTSTRFVTMHLGEGALVIEIYNLFSGPRDQPSYLLVSTLTKPPSRSTPTPNK
jgi:hypothetical protein